MYDLQVTQKIRSNWSLCEKNIIDYFIQIRRKQILWIIILLCMIGFLEAYYACQELYFETTFPHSANEVVFLKIKAETGFSRLKRQRSRAGSCTAMGDMNAGLGVLRKAA